MPIHEAVRLAVAQIRVQKLKSFFTLLGVTIGVMFLIAVVSIVEGMGRYMEDDLVGKIITKGSFEVRRRPNINMGDVDESVWREYATRPRMTEDDVDPVTRVLVPGSRWAIVGSDPVTVESRFARPRKPYLNAVSDQWMAIKNLGVTEGRVIAPQEYASGAHVVVIGQDLKTHFFPGLSPIGRELKVGDLPYTVVGVAEKQGSAFGLSMDSFLIAPYKSPAHRLVNRFKIIDAIIVQSPSDVAMRANMENVEEAMRQQRRLRPTQRDNFVLETSDSALEFWRKVQGFLVWAGIALPAIGLVVGAIVIMNIMLVAVAERTREIGVRKALGARRRDILRQFIVESTVLALIGSVFGILAGAGLAKTVAAVSPLPAQVALWSVIVAVSVGAGVGIVAGVYPASRASRLDPVIALRQE